MCAVYQIESGFGKAYTGRMMQYWTDTLHMAPAWTAGFFALMVWSIVWKGFALWRAAQRSEKVWFIVFLIINTAGILEILYLFVVTRKRK